MRALAILAAIAMMHTAHALPRQDLAARLGEDDLSNDSHVFHHLDRNPRTANRNRNRIYGEGVDGSELYVVKKFPGREQRAESRAMARDSKLDGRFIQDPDYSQGDTGGGSSSAGPAPNAESTQRPPNNAEKPGEADNSLGRSRG